MSKGELTKEQRGAARNKARALAIHAGPGAGKTRVLAYRIAYLVNDEAVAPENIVAVTFTRKAAGELRGRLKKLLGKKGAWVWVGTFHALGLYLLHTHRKVAGLPEFPSVYGTADQEAILTELLRARDASTKSIVLNDLRREISSAKFKLITPEKMARRAESPAQEEVAELYRDYQQSLETSRALDFDDLISRPVALLRDTRKVREEVRGKFTHVFVDEFQDTNAAQLELLRYIVPRRGWITVVGDEDQAIYQWRGASKKVFERFQARYEPTIIRLSTNLRSTGHIVAGAASVVAPIQGRTPRAWSSSRKNGHQIRVLECSDGPDEANRAAEHLQRLHSEGVPWHEMAVLYRINDQAQMIIDVLREADIPIRTARQDSRTAAQDDAAARAWLRLATQNRFDEAAVLLTLPQFPGVSRATVNRIVNSARAKRIPIGDVLRSNGLPDDLSARAINAVANYKKRVRELREFAVSAPTKTKTARKILEIAGVSSEVCDRVEKEFRAYLKHTQSGNLSGFACSNFSEECSETSDGVTLSTMHAAKGLEFEAVFVVGVEEGLMPYVETRTEEKLDAERRLLYVAMTRAKRHLILSYTQWRRIQGVARKTGPSRFLDDLGSSAR